MNSFYDVRHPDFGAVGDGATDDTLAIQAAIDAASAAGGGTVVIGDGIYKVGNPSGDASTCVPVQVKSNVRILIHASATVRAAVLNWVSRGVFEAVDVTSVAFEGRGTIDGQASANPGGRVFGIYLRSATRYTVRDLKIVNMPANTGTNAGGLGGDAIIMEDSASQAGVPSRDGLIENVWIDNVERSGISPICAERLTIRDCRIRNVTGSNPGSAIDLEPDVANGIVRDITVEANHIENCHWGVIVNGNGPRDVSVIGNTIRGARNNGIFTRATNVTVKGNVLFNWTGRGIWVYAGSQGVTVSGNTLEGDFTNTAQRAAIAVTDAYDISVVGNTVRKSYTTGIQVDVKFNGGGSTQGIVIAQNTLYNTGRDAETGGSAISVISDSGAGRTARDIAVCFNTIRDDRSGAAVVDAGVDVTSTSAGERATYHVFGNRVSGPATHMAGSYSIITGQLVDRPSINFGTVAAGAAAEQTVALTGATTADSVQATPIGGLEAGLQVAAAWVSAADQVTVRVHNFSGSGVSSSRTWRIITTQH